MACARLGAGRYAHDGGAALPLKQSCENRNLRQNLRRADLAANQGLVRAHGGVDSTPCGVGRVLSGQHKALTTAEVLGRGEALENDGSELLRAGHGDAGTAKWLMVCSAVGVYVTKGVRPRRPAVQCRGMPAIEHSLLLASIYTASIYAVLVAFATGLTRNPRIAARLLPSGHRYGGIDGLRGLLACGVFIHHTFAASIYFTTGRWGWSESPLLNHLGQTTVALFFMITAFLFSTRLMAGSVNWRSMYVTRITRLTPLYLVYVAGVLGAVLVFGGATLREPMSKVAVEVGHWLAFGMLQRPDINAVPRTWTFSAGVNWSLRFEWFFYAAMPLLSIALSFIKSRGRQVAAVFALLLIGIAASGRVIEGPKLYLLHFAAGTVAALLYRHVGVRDLLKARWVMPAGTAALLSLLAFTHASGGAQVLVTTLFFVSCLGSSSGVLHWRGVRWLGEISYGVYLLHGLILCATFAAMGSNLRALTPIEFVALCAGLGIFVVCVASTLHFSVELPGIRFGKSLSYKILPAREALTAT